MRYFFGHISRFSVIAAVALLSCACTETNVSPLPSVSEEARARLASPVNCRTARRDIQVLEAERASTARRIVAGVRAVFPVSAVAGILSGDYNDRVAVATGQYNDDISAKIDQIRASCGVR